MLSNSTTLAKPKKPRLDWRKALGLHPDDPLFPHKSGRWAKKVRGKFACFGKMDHYRRSCQPKRRERKGTNQHGEWQTESIDHTEGNLQCLRLAARLMEQRWKMEEKCPQPSPHALAHCDRDTFINRLISMRHYAEVRGEVPRGEQPGTLVMRLLGELLGWRDPYSTDVQPRAAAQPPAAAAPTEQRDGVGSLWPKETPDHANASPAKDSRPLSVRPLSVGEHHAPAAPAAHTANNISAGAAAYEPAADADSGDGSGCSEKSYVESPEADSGSEHAQDEKKLSVNISAGTAGLASRGTHRGSPQPASRGTRQPASSGTPTRATSRSYAEEERLALAELERTFCEHLWPSIADHGVTNLLAQGQTNLMLQGYTREQRQALLGWQRVMDLRKEKECAAKAAG